MKREFRDMKYAIKLEWILCSFAGTWLKGGCSVILVNNQLDSQFFMYVYLCVNLVIYKDHTRMHGQQNLKKWL